MRKIFSLILSVCLAVSSFSMPSSVGVSDSVPTGQYKGQGNTVEELSEQWNLMKPVLHGYPYWDTPQTTFPYSIGKLSENVLRNAINMTNFVRWQAGLLPVALDDSYNFECQTGSLVNAINKKLTHLPEQPEGMSREQYEIGAKACGSSNLAVFNGNYYDAKDDILSTAIMLYMDDSDDGNIVNVGHRRWILNPAMGKTGFGCVENYTSMKSFDTSSDATADCVMWPTAGYFPYEMLKKATSNNGTPWTVSLDSSLYGIKYADEVKITMINRTTGVETVFTNGLSGDNLDPGGDYFNISTVLMGMDYCLVFRPKSGVVQLSDEFTVTVSSLKSPSGQLRPDISYDTCIISAENPTLLKSKYTVSIETDKPYSLGNGSPVRFTVKVFGQDGEEIKMLLLKVYPPASTNTYYAAISGLSSAIGGANVSGNYRIVIPAQELKGYLYSETVVDYYLPYIDDYEEQTSTTTATTTAVTTTAAKLEMSLWGDVNCDDKFDAFDIVSIRKSIADPDGYPLSEQGKANINSDEPTLEHLFMLQNQLYSG